MAERHQGRCTRPHDRSRTFRRRAAAAALAGSAALGAGLTAPQAAQAAAAPLRAPSAAGAHYWYLKHGHWYWTSHYDKYKAFLASGGIGNGTAGPDFTQHPSSGPSAAPGASKKPAKPKKPAPAQDAAPKGAPLSAAAAQKAVAYARAQIGKPYKWGGNGPNAFDCSGLVQQAFLRAGVRLPRTTWQQAAATQHIAKSALRPGDLVHWSNNGKDSGAYHIAIYVGGQQYIEAPRPGKKVRQVSISWGPKPSFYTRVTA